MYLAYNYLSKKQRRYNYANATDLTLKIAVGGKTLDYKNDSL